MRHKQRSKWTGQYANGPQCEVCGRPAGYSYLSLPDTDRTGYGLVLCMRAGCWEQAQVEQEQRISKQEA